MTRHVYDRSNRYSPTDQKNILDYYSYKEGGIKRRVKARITAFDGKKIIGWKMAKYKNLSLLWFVLIKLEIPVTANRVQPRNFKCRASRAKVLEIKPINFNFSLMPTEDIELAYSLWTSSFIYKVGKIVKPSKPFDRDFRTECASGIHFYLTEQEARKHYQ